MGQPYVASVDHVQFVGMVSNADAHDIPPGASQIQVNLQVVSPGTLRVRGGMLPLSFEEE